MNIVSSYTCSECRGTGMAQSETFSVGPRGFDNPLKHLPEKEVALIATRPKNPREWIDSVSKTLEKEFSSLDAESLKTLMGSDKTLQLSLLVHSIQINVHFVICESGSGPGSGKSSPIPSLISISQTHSENIMNPSVQLGRDDEQKSEGASSDEDGSEGSEPSLASSPETSTLTQKKEKSASLELQKTTPLTPSGSPVTATKPVSITRRQSNLL